MKVVIPNEEDGFRKYSHTFCGLDSFLIIPEIDAKWNKRNLFYRSLIVDLEGNVLSSGWPKFFNQGEKPDCYPDPEKHKDWCIQEKVDGSLLIADYVNGQFNMRTRGCVSHTQQENAKDFELLTVKYPKIIEFLKQNSHLSLLFEIVTPNNVIVIHPKEIDFYFLGAINKNGMCVVASNDLVDIWRKIGCVPTPQTYEIDNVKDLGAICQMVKDWKGSEGVVVSYNNNQNRIKIKSDWYLWIHRIKSQLNSENNLIEYYVNADMPKFEEFYSKVEKDFDYELAKQLIPMISKVCDAGETVNKIVEGMENFVSSIRNFDNRKQQAEHIISSYGKTNRASFVFSILDGKELNKEQLIKLVHQSL